MQSLDVDSRLIGLRLLRQKAGHAEQVYKQATSFRTVKW